MRVGPPAPGHRRLRWGGALVLVAFVGLLLREVRAEPKPAARALRNLTVTAQGPGAAALRLPIQQGVLTGRVVSDGRRLAIVEHRVAACNKRHRGLEELFDDACSSGRRCLKFEGFAGDASCGPDRIEVKLADSEDDSALTMGETRFLRFALRVDESLRELTTAPLISQVWQASSVASGQRPALGPVLAISIASNRADPDRLVDVDFRYRNEVSAANPPHPFLSVPMPKAEWHTFYLELTPRSPGHPAGKGEVLVWVDPTGELRPEAARNYDRSEPSHYRFYWGYRRDPSTGLGERFDVRVGIYRPEPLGNIKFWLDGALLTTDRAVWASAG